MRHNTLPETLIAIFAKLGALILLLFIGQVTEVAGQIKVYAPDSSSHISLSGIARFKYDVITPPNQPTVSRLSVQSARLHVRGSAFDPKLTFFLQVALDPNLVERVPEDPNKTLLDMWVHYNFNKNFGARIGQFILPVLPQGSTGLLALQFIDRSIVSRNFTYNRDAALHLYAQTDIGGIIFRPQINIAAGEGRAFSSISTNTGQQYIFKLEVLGGGEFKTGGGFNEADLDREGHPKTSFSIGYEINNNPGRARGNAGPFLYAPSGLPFEGKIKSFFMGGIFKYKGASAIFEYIDRQVDNDQFMSGKGLMLQGGYLFDNNMELALRYANVELDGMTEKQTERRIALSKYISNHRLKVQADYGQVKSFSDVASKEFRVVMQVWI